MKKKVALFFHLEEEDEREAYEILEGLGRKKSAAVIHLIISHKDELATFKAKPRSRIHVPVEQQKKVNVVTLQKPDETKLEKSQSSEFTKKEEIPQSIEENEEEGEKPLDAALILQGLQSFGL